MKHPHRSPKRWTPRGSRRWREEQAGPVGSDEILKELYDIDGMERPWWAKLARKHGWMTLREYFDVPPEPTGKPTLRELMYEKHPLLNMVPKGAWFGMLPKGGACE